MFLDRYDDNRHIHRELFDVTTEPIVCEGSAPYDLHIFTIKGNGVGDVMSITFGGKMIQVGKTMIGVYDGVTDELDITNSASFVVLNSIKADGCLDVMALLSNLR